MLAICLLVTQFLFQSCSARAKILYCEWQNFEISNSGGATMYKNQNHQENYYYYLVFSYQTMSESDERLVTIVESMTDNEAKIQNDLITIHGT